MQIRVIASDFQYRKYHTQIDEKCARTLELPLLVWRCIIHIPFCSVRLWAEFTVFSPC